MASLVVVSLLLATPVHAQTEEEECLPALNNDSIITLPQEKPKKKNFIVRIIDAFDDIDSTYIERIMYNYTAMLQASRNYEFYTIGANDFDQRLSFAERSNLCIGPYFGWRWIFLGYTFDVTHLGERPKNRGFDLSFSLYSSKLGVDLLLRRKGYNFYFRSIKGLGDAAQELEGQECNDYISTTLIGLKIYYIFNSRHFSNPAIFSQSTIQRRSAGSFMLGASFSLHDVDFNYKALSPSVIGSSSAGETFAALERIKYTDYSIQVGYGYNWAFARNWCLGLSLQPAIGLKWASAQTAILKNQETSDLTPENEDNESNPFVKLRDSFRRNATFDIDVTARAGLIYNSGRWFVGLTGILHNYNYRRDDFTFNNTFGSVNLFAGFFFQKRKPKGAKVKAEPQPLPVKPEQPIIEN